MTSGTTPSIVARLAFTVALVALAPAAVAAQDPALEQAAGEPLVSSAVSAGTPPACVDGLPPSAFRPTMVFLVADNAGEPFRRVPEAGLLAVRLATESLAWQARMLLGAKDGELPPADTLLSWRNLGRHLHVVGHRDGRITWSYPWDTPGHGPLRDPVGEVALALLGKAVDTAMARNERFAWPDGVDGDSIPFLIRFDYPDLDEKGKLEPLRGMHAAALLPVRVPMHTPVAPLRTGSIAYPETLRRMGVQGTLVMQFVVDTTGRPIQQSIRDIWPDQRPRLTGDMRFFYNEFMFEVKRSLKGSQYRPARLGGCAIRQLVQQPFVFELKR